MHKRTRPDDLGIKSRAQGKAPQFADLPLCCQVGHTPSVGCGILGPCALVIGLVHHAQHKLIPHSAWRGLLLTTRAIKYPLNGWWCPSGYGKE